MTPFHALSKEGSGVPTPKVHLFWPREQFWPPASIPGTTTYNTGDSGTGTQVRWVKCQHVNGTAPNGDDKMSKVNRKRLTIE